jgi:hypothetical protein
LRDACADNESRRLTLDLVVMGSIGCQQGQERAYWLLRFLRSIAEHMEAQAES